MLAEYFEKYSDAPNDDPGLWGYSATCESAVRIEYFKSGARHGPFALLGVIHTDELSRQQGHATRVLEDLSARADRFGVPIEVSPDVRYKWLVDLYARHSFAYGGSASRDHRMRREPKRDDSNA